MADPPPHCRLDASGDLEVVFCHQCENEWYRENGGLVCPRCEGEVTEIITPETDPRPVYNRSQSPPDLPDLVDLHNHYLWQHDDSDPGDPEEADIEEHVTRMPGGSVMYTRTTRSTARNDRGARPPGQNQPDMMMQDFQEIFGTLLGPGFQPGRPGRSGQDDLFPRGFGTVRMGGATIGGGRGPRVVGGRYTFGTPLQPRNADRAQEGSQNDRPVDDLATIIGNIFGQMGGPAVDGEHGARAGGGLPQGLQGLQGLFASLMNPANARMGDAVYTQEALDQIISNLMEAHPTSNAPGPASPDAIAALPKKKLDEKQIGPEGKAECSVCMDDVHVGDEVVVLPCTHWFHEVCASAWLSEHNTCPICRKGIEGGDPNNRPSNSRRSSQNATPPASAMEAAVNERRLRQRRVSAAAREARLNSNRDAGNRSPEESSSRQPPTSSRDLNNDMEDYTRQMPGSFSHRDSERSDSHREIRTNTSSSDSRESRRSSTSGASNGGAMSWLRGRLGGNSRRHD